ncbi:Adenylate kinase [Tritrichomonas foetus]|uniref:Adenylate kinase n=1 Tax=Tritrichomonas foetus TaxID=1144522 RepID=A0A1J4K245_9EUKA|nr:Adenylate kinase [Tritrichomonas foetus]|eukprot:OHT05034.1 Adenylate kinase [Tritrichomonas foetus]
MSLKPLRIIFFGPPGSGKGTQSEKLVNEFKLDHLSTGDALRAEIRAMSPLGKRVKSIIEAGKLVDDQTIMEIVKSAIEKGNKNAFILDGIPRTIGQARQLDDIVNEMGIPITHVPYLNITRAALKERVCGRLFHPGSGRVYHRSYNPPKVPMKDDITGEPLIIRKDDTEEVFDARMKEYDATFEPVLEFYMKKGIVHTVTGDNLSIDQVYAELKKYIIQ